MNEALTDAEYITRRRVAYAIWEAEGKPDRRELKHWEQAGRRIEYWRALGFSNGGEPTAEQSKAALARAYTLRNFEIEHYWKRATYFWAFQVAIFGALAFLFGGRNAATAPHSIAFALALMGVLTALASFLTARGSKFWQENWERHIDMLEDSSEGRLHKTVWLDNGKISFSVSRINQRLNSYFVGFWVLVAAYFAWRSLGSIPLGMLSSAWTYVPVLAGITVICAAGLYSQWTSLHGSLPGADKAKEPALVHRKRLNRQVYLRSAPDQDSI